MKKISNFESIRKSDHFELKASNVLVINKISSMEKFLIAFLLFVLLFKIGVSQSNAGKPIVIRANYFDISPPLRDIIQDPNIKVDMTWEEGIVKNILYPKELFPNPKDTMATDPNSIQNRFGLLIADTTQQNFEGVAGDGLTCPPDTDGDVGPNHYFSVVNKRYAIYNKTGDLLLGPFPNTQVFTGLPNNSNGGDAIVLFDEQANRWLFSQLSLPNAPYGPFYENVAISQTADPTGSWYRYQFEFSELPDYPKLSVWPDGYYMTTNRFSQGTYTIAGTGAIAMDRVKMLAGDPSATMIYFTLPASNQAWAVLPSDCDGAFPPAGTPCYFAYSKPSYITVFEFHADWNTPSNSSYTEVITLPVATFSGDLYAIPQKGTTAKIGSIAGILMFRLQFRKFSDHLSMVASGTVNVNGVAGVRWYELRKTGSNPWVIYQQSTYSPDNKHRWMGSIAMDSSGNIALGYSISSSTMYPSIRYCGRLNSDPLNTMTIAENSIIEGGGSQTNTWSGNPGRWGDYSCMNVDPSIPTTFWYTQEYYETTSEANWKTRIGSFTFNNIFASYATACPTIICSGDSTQLTSFAYGGSGTYTYSWSSIPIGFGSNLQKPKTSVAEPTKYIVAVSDGTQTHHDTTEVSHVTLQPSCFAGNDVFISAPVPSFIDLHGTADNYRAFGWVSNGDGHFSNSQLLNTTYFFGPADTLYGNTIDLKLIALPISPCHDNVASTMQVFFFGVGIKESGIDHLEIYPNPADDILNISFRINEMQSVKVKLISLEGVTIYSESVVKFDGNFTKQIDLAFLSKGIYMLQISTDHGTTISKVVVQ